VDPPPPPPPPDPLPPPSGQQSSIGDPAASDAGSASFTDTTTWSIGDADDLPLYRPPRISLAARREPTATGNDLIVVSLESSCTPMSVRWSADGTIRERGSTVRWLPDSEWAQLRVAVRTRGGVAVAAIRAADVRS
jgi:hypothetical protein